MGQRPGSGHCCSGVKTGEFLTEARWELDVPEKPKALPVTDMLFTHKGALVLAQRGEATSTYDYSSFAAHGKARVYRYWLENPDDPNTPSRWIAEPEEHAVGFEVNNRQTSGGLSLNHGYSKDGFLDTSVCEASLWTTGDDLRKTEVKELIDALSPGGPLPVDGLQGMPADPVKQYAKGNNTPPWASYMLDNNPDDTELLDINGEPSRWSDARTEGWIGDVAILQTDCDAVAQGGNGGSGGYWGGAGYPWSNPDYIYNPDDPVDPDPVCTPGVDCPVTKCTPGVDCPPAQCAEPDGKFVCDPVTGSWTYMMNIDPADLAALNADTVKITGTSPGISVPAGPVLPVGPTTPINILGSGGGQLVTVGLCLFNKAEKDSGRPYTCCKTSVTAQMPRGECKKQN